MKPSILMLAIIALIALFIPLGAVGLETPITIDGNIEMAALPGVTGTGSETDPFVLEGVHFEGGNGCPLLALRGVTAHTIIRDCTFADAEDIALDLRSCSNVWILSCVFADNALAVSVSTDCVDIVIALNTFERNEEDVRGDASSISLNDGFAGNWWDGNATFDMNGDGLSEIPYFVCAGEQPLLDRHSLVFPYVGNHAEDVEGIRLEVRFSPGDAYRLESRTETDLTIHTSDSSTCTKLTQELEYAVQVLSAPGTGYAEVLSEVTSDSGSMTVDGEPYDYDITQGASLLMGSHRFGGSMNAAPGTSGSDVFPGAIQTTYAVYPVRPISVGHAWTSVSHPDPSQAGLSQGTCVTETACVLARLDELRGAACAVIKVQSMTTVDGYVRNELLESDVYMTGTVDTDIMLWVGLSTGETLRAIITSEAAFDNVMENEHLTTIEYGIHIETELYDDV